MSESETTPRHRARILVVDDEFFIRKSLKRILARQGYEVLGAGDGPTALEIAAEEEIDIALIDLRLKGSMDGHEVLRELKENSSRTECILITAFGTAADAFQALNAGAYDYFEKPIDDWVRFNQILRKALETRDLKEERNRLAAQLGDGRDPDQLVGNPPPMLRLNQMIRDVARVPFPVLVTGESGSGKERVARAIHTNSPRADAPFVAINCTSLPGNLHESELFGHKKGAFTGADTSRKGHFLAANKGTILLDEIGDMPLEAQGKLLRVLQEGTIQPVGSDETVSIDVRVLAATNRDLELAVASGQFRQDLYFRLNVIHIRVPPLRERASDIPLLCWFFLQRYNRELDRSVKRFSEAALRLLEKYQWPGNVRELENQIGRAMAFVRGDELGPELFHEISESLGATNDETVSAAQPTSGDTVFAESLLELDYTEAKERVVREFSRLYLAQRLLQNGWNITRAAEMSGQQRPNFKKLMVRFGVEKPSAEELEQKVKG